MNKGITLLILLVVLGAMGLVMYSHGNSGKPAPALPSAAVAPVDGSAGGPAGDLAQRNGYASPLQAPQGGGGGLRPIEPPIGAAANTDGAPRAVTLTAGGDPRTVRPVVPQRTEEPAPPVTVEPKTSGATRQEQPSAQAKPQTAAPAQTKPQAPPAQTKPQTPAAQSKTPAQNKPESAAGSQPEPRTTAQPAASATEGNSATPARPGTMQSGTAQSGTPGLMAGPTPWDAPKQGASGQGQIQGQAQGQMQGQTQSGASGVSEGSVTASLTPSPTASTNPRQPPVTDPIVSEKSLSKTGSHSLRSIHLGFSGQQMQLRIEAGEPFPVKAFALTNPDRLVVDLPGTWKDMKAPSVPDNSIVSAIRLGQQPGGPRLVLDLKGPLKNHAIERSGNRVDVMVR